MSTFNNLNFGYIGNAGERGLIRWRKKLTRRSDQRTDVYGLPFLKSETLPKWCSYVPFLPSFDESLYSFSSICKRPMKVTPWTENEDTSVNTSEERSTSRQLDGDAPPPRRRRSPSQKTVSFGMDTPTVTISEN